jgi:cobalt/nickel transport system permease protein
MYPLAVHIADVLPPAWWASGFAAAIALLIANGRRLADDEIPRLALLSAAFFVSSLIHVRIGPTSVHLLLTGLVGIILGRRAVLAIAVGLVLQAVLLGHGGFSSLGVNVCVMTLPAYLAAALFGFLRQRPVFCRPIGRGLLVAASVTIWSLAVSAGLEMTLAQWHGNAADWLAHPSRWATLSPPMLLTIAMIGVVAAIGERRLENSPDFPIGLLVGEVAVLATVGLNAVVLRLALPDEAGAVAPVVFVAHLPIAALEGIICGFTVSFLVKVAPQTLAGSCLVERLDVVERNLPLAQSNADQR